jgi:hypothetical protein
VGLKSYIPFGPFLVAGAVLTLLRDDHLLGELGALGAVATAAGGWPSILLSSGPL